MAWLRSDVEALDSEADHLQTVALSKALRVPVTLYCLENVQKGGPSKVRTMGDDVQSEYDLLFRPGHYDLLYRAKGAMEDDEDEQKGGGVEAENEVEDEQKGGGVEAENE